MATLSEMVAKIRSSFKLIDGDNTISNRFIASELLSTNLKLLKQQTDKRRLLMSDNIFVQISCLELELVPLSSCCNYNSSCNIRKSKQRLPKILENIYGPMLKLYSLEKTAEYNFMDVNRYVNVINIYPNRIRSAKVWWIHDGYLYCTDYFLETVEVRFVPEEYFDLNKYSCDKTETCPKNPMDLEFKCPGYLELDLINIVRNTISQTYKRSLRDETVDNKDQSK